MVAKVPFIFQRRPGRLYGFEHYRFLHIFVAEICRASTGR